MRCIYIYNYNESYLPTYILYSATRRINVEGKEGKKKDIHTLLTLYTYIKKHKIKNQKKFFFFFFGVADAGADVALLRKMQGPVGPCAPCLPGLPGLPGG